jgi:hypothetical protein
MRQQAVALFDMDYQTGVAQFDTLFSQLCEQVFQRTRGIRLEALDGDRITGFQPFSIRLL